MNGSVSCYKLKIAILCREEPFTVLELPFTAEQAAHWTTAQASLEMHYPSTLYTIHEFGVALSTPNEQTYHSKS